MNEDEVAINILYWQVLILIFIAFVSMSKCIFVVF